MGPAEAETPPVVSARPYRVAPLQAFPSPASITSPLDSPTFSRSLAGSRKTSPWTPASLVSATTAPISPAPGLVDFKAVDTPPAADILLETGLNTIVGGALAPVHVTPPRTRSATKRGPGLRLPSFRDLGIAAPHPDRYGQPALDGTFTDAPNDTMEGPLGSSVGDAPLRNALEHLHLAQNPTSNGSGADLTGGRAVNSPVKHFIATLTPPEEAGDMKWPSLESVSSAPIMSPSMEHGHEPLGAGSALPAPTAADSTTLAQRPREPAGPSRGGNSWIDGAVHTLRSQYRSQWPSNPLRILSHALPSPSPTGHVFPQVISEIHNSTPSSPTVWISVFHAIPGRFNLTDLPTSPPATPGQPIGGEDYFTQKVFDSAVPITDYQEDLSALPRSPRPVVPPSTINISVVERYIPPTNANEFEKMFNDDGPSILVDRLVELSPDYGSLAFIYPTRTGGMIFKQKYLGPVLDPILRSMQIVHGLSSDLGISLGNMSAIERLLEFDDLKRKMNILCAALTQRSTSMQRFHGRRAHYQVTYAAKQRVRLGRDVWAHDWWTKQEKPRVREMITKYAREASKKSSNEHMERPATPAELIQHLLDSVNKKAYPAGQEPTEGVEVGVFVIQRSEL
ncbi:hypothetical protein Tdes44962_MAKER03874 [Teratosphaeria destructans]|uniref:Uncharacterized protein n=1 Tax=Teratosphaeria destructans TaxID=418781 RepID=A0A9W7SNP3_9PEZI|nr:hypothetical protein Tdes44962_MAKER03874 [Teratosphaeria destructans]